MWCGVAPIRPSAPRTCTPHFSSAATRFFWSYGEWREEPEGREIGKEKVSMMLTDYIIQGQAMTLVMGLVDEEDNWDGPKYVAERVYGIDSLVGSLLINDRTAWNGKKAYDLMSLSLPN